MQFEIDVEQEQNSHKANREIDFKMTMSWDRKMNNFPSTDVKKIILNTTLNISLF